MRHYKMLMTLALGLAIHGSQAPALPNPAKGSSLGLAAVAPTQPTKPAAIASVANPALAWIGAETIRQSDFTLFLQTSLNEVERLRAELDPTAKAKYMAQFLDFKVLAAKARKEGLQREPLHAKKLALLDAQLLSRSLLVRDGPVLAARSTLSEDQLKAYFAAHQDQFRTPGTFTARHILVTTQADDGQQPIPDEVARQKADKILEEIRGGKSFEQAAREYSDDSQSRANGGLYEDIPFGKLLPELEQTISTQEVGTVGQPVKTKAGYHLIEVEKITPPEPRTFEAAREDVKEKASAERQMQVAEEYLRGARKETGFKLAPGLSEKTVPLAGNEGP